LKGGGGLVLEIWINFTKKTGIDALQVTTHYIFDYDQLMHQRLKIQYCQILAYKLRLQDYKSEAVKIFNALNFRFFAVGDFYNDIGMLEESELDGLIQTPQKVIDNLPSLPPRKIVTN
jgi:hypothetical protein